MKETTFNVYFNDGVKSPIIVFEADTLADCKDWIEEQLKGKHQSMMSTVPLYGRCNEFVKNIRLRGL